MTETMSTDSVKTKFWQIAPGAGGRLWHDLRKHSIAAIGFSKMEFDLTGNTDQELITLFRESHKSEKAITVTIKAKQLSNFINLKPGDKIITNRGVTSLLALGLVKSSYKFRPERSEYKHTVDVDYYKISETGIPIPDKFKRKYFGKTIVPVPKTDFEDMERLFYESADLNYWIFQANPNLYDLSGALNVLNKVLWGVYQHKNKIRKNDIVFLWEAGPHAGILAQAVIEDIPKYMPELEAERPFMRKPEKFDVAKLQVPLRISYVFPTQLSKDYLKSHSKLKDLPILRFAQGTNFPVTTAQGEALLDEIGSMRAGAAGKMFIPDRTDFEKAYHMIATTYEEVSIDSIMDQIEVNTTKDGHVLKDNWRTITEKNIEIWSSEKL